MPSGLWVTDCSSSDWAWLDLGCVTQNIGSAVGNTVGSAVGGAISPLLTPLLVIGIFIVIIVAIIAFSPNVKHIIPHVGFG